MNNIFDMHYKALYNLRFKLPVIKTVMKSDNCSRDQAVYRLASLTTYRAVNGIYSR